MISLYEYSTAMVKPILEANLAAGEKKWEDYDTVKVPLADGTYEIVDMKKLIKEQDRAKAALSHIQPFFSGLIGGVRYIYTFRVPTQATDGKSIYVNPLFTSRLSFENKVFVLAHEIMHCVLNHLRREKIHGCTDHKKANIAADYEVNITLCDWDICNINTIRNEIKAYVDTKWSGKGFETIYDTMGDPKQDQNQNSPQQKQSSGDNDGKSGNGGSESSKHSADYKKGWAQAIKDYKEGKLKL